MGDYAIKNQLCITASEVGKNCWKTSLQWEAIFSECWNSFKGEATGVCNLCIAISKVGCEVGILYGSTCAAVDEIGLCKVCSAVACWQSKGMLEHLQADCLKSVQDNSV